MHLDTYFSFLSILCLKRLIWSKQNSLKSCKRKLLPKTANNFTNRFQIQICMPSFLFSHKLLMASISASTLLIFITLSLAFPSISPATVVQDLNTLHPPPEFKTTISNNCKDNPSLRYCNLSLTPSNLEEIFKFTIVASHLCNVSNNPNCQEDFPKIDLKNHPKIAPLYLSFDFFWKYCPLTVISIDLANNSLKGSFPSDIFYCSQIQSLDLSLNRLSGEFPIQNFSFLPNLSFLNLSYNHFESEILDHDFYKRFNSSSFLDSGLAPNHKKFTIQAIVLLIALPVFVISMILLICLPKFIQRKDRFTPSMLKASTNGFSKKNLVATSEGVLIYRGIIEDGSEVRIEVYKGNLLRQERVNFVAECEILVQLNHKNLVRILGWCNDRKLRAIIAEWVGGESVETWLVRGVLTWKDRAEVLVKILECMCYLEAEWPEVGYDLKSCSILLGEDLEPLISRFKVGDNNSSRKKVYKFGVLVLEMISNRRPREEFGGGEPEFVEWMSSHFAEKEWNMILDQGMHIRTEQYTSLHRATQLGLICTVDILAAQRPTLEQITQAMSLIFNSLTPRQH